MSRSAGRPEPAAAARRARTALPGLLSGSRVVLAPCFAWTLFSSPWLASLVAVVAATTDFVDGRLARRLGSESSRGAVVDVLGDAAFVLVGTGALAWGGILSPLLPLAAALSLSALAGSWWSRPPTAPPNGMRRWPDRIGHVAGILNYGAVLVGVGTVALDVRLSLVAASQLVALVNLAPIVLRWVEAYGEGRRSSSR